MGFTLLSFGFTFLCPQVTVFFSRFKKIFGKQKQPLPEFSGAAFFLNKEEKIFSKFTKKNGRKWA